MLLLTNVHFSVKRPIVLILKIKTWTCEHLFCGGWLVSVLAQFLNMSHRSFSMGVLPMVLRKYSCSIFSELTKWRDGSRSSSLPNLDGQELTFICSYVWNFSVLYQKIKSRGLTWNTGWDKLNGCADPATPETGLVDSPPALGLWGCAPLFQESKNEPWVTMFLQQWALAAGLITAYLVWKVQWPSGRQIQ